jgi:long-chain acyl-CoA synthetase
MPILDELGRRPDDAIVLVSENQCLSNHALQARVTSLKGALLKRETRCVALYADNGIDWVVADLACLEAGVRIVPVPLFFSSQQIAHVLDTSGADLLLLDQSMSQRFAELSPPATFPGLDQLRGHDLAPRSPAEVPAGTWKIT